MSPFCCIVPQHIPAERDSRIIEAKTSCYYTVTVPGVLGYEEMLAWVHHDPAPYPYWILARAEMMLIGILLWWMVANAYQPILRRSPNNSFDFWFRSQLNRCESSQMRGKTRHSTHSVAPSLRRLKRYEACLVTVPYKSYDSLVAAERGQPLSTRHLRALNTRATY